MNGNTDAKYCSRLCACRDRNTKEHQKKAGKIGALHNILKRGTGRKDVYVKENGQHQHRRVAEKIIGRKLKKSEIVHHIDENKHNNNPSNLKIWNQSEHEKYHGKKLYKKGIIFPSNKRN